MPRGSSGPRNNANWPDDQREIHSQQLRGLQLDLWLAQDHFEAAEAWVEQQRGALSEDDWCALLSRIWRSAWQHAIAMPRQRNGCASGCAAIRNSWHSTTSLRELTQLQGRTRQAIALLTRAIHLANAHGQAH